MGIALDAFHEGIDVRLAEAAAEGGELVRIEVLVAEIDDLVLEERAMDLRPGAIVERPAQVRALDLGAEAPAIGFTTMVS
jgi:hypothetical protein